MEKVHHIFFNLRHFSFLDLKNAKPLSAKHTLPCFLLMLFLLSHPVFSEVMPESQKETEVFKGSNTSVFKKQVTIMTKPLKHIHRLIFLREHTSCENSRYTWNLGHNIITAATV